MAKLTFMFTRQEESCTGNRVCGPDWGQRKVAMSSPLFFVRGLHNRGRERPARWRGLLINDGKGTFWVWFRILIESKIVLLTEKSVMILFGGNGCACKKASAPPLHQFHSLQMLFNLLLWVRTIPSRWFGVWKLIISKWFVVWSIVRIGVKQQTISEKQVTHFAAWLKLFKE